MSPSVPVLKRPAGPPPAAARGRRSRASASAFPLLPALAATLLLLGIGQAALWWWGGRLPSSPTYVTAARTALPLATRRAMPPQRLQTSPLPQNIQFGDALGTVVVTIFTDPACGTCRARVHNLTSGLPVRGVRQVYKFWPQKTGRTTSGLLTELARREAVIPAYWKALQAEGDRDLSDIDMLQLLEQAGLPLDVQREALSRHSGELYEALSLDLQTAQKAELPPPPVIMVDDYVLDTPALTPATLASYVEKRKEGRQLAREDQLWLMRK